MIPKDIPATAKTKCCPVPVVETNRAIKSTQLGEVLDLIATDVGSRIDNFAGSGVGRRSGIDAGPSRNFGEHIPAWCQRTGHELIHTEEKDENSATPCANAANANH